MSTYLPSSLLHIVLIISRFESAKRKSCVYQPALVNHDSLESYIGRVDVARALVREVTLHAIGCGERFDRWINGLLEHKGIIDLAFFHPAYTEPPLWIQVAFANTANWGLKVTCNGVTQWIVPVWNPNDKKKCDDILYKRAHQPGRTDSVDLSEAAADFGHALDDAADLAHRVKLGEFQSIFERSRAKLNGYIHFSKFGGQLLDDDVFTHAARMLFDAAGTCWVFGGMGSWTDHDFTDPAVQVKVDQVTGKLYVALTEALLSAVNRGRKPE